MANISFSKPELIISQPRIEYGLQIVFDLLKTKRSTNPKPEVVLRRRSNNNEFKNDKTMISP